METLKNNWLRTIAGLTLVLGLILGVKAMNHPDVNKNTKIALTDTYFKYTGALGQEDDITLWEATTSSFDCGGGANKACKIKVRAEYLMLDASNQVVINPAQLPSISLVPGANNQNNVPDPAQAGGNPSYPILSGEIHNRN